MDKTGVNTERIAIFAVVSVFLIFLIRVLSVEDPSMKTALLPAPAAGTPSSESEEALPLSFNETEHDFGDCQSGEVLHCTFTFTNPTDRPVEGLEVRATCGCTSTLLTDSDIPPGGSGKIDVTLRTAGPGGLMEKHVTVTASGTPGMTVLTLKTVVVATVKMVARPP